MTRFVRGLLVSLALLLAMVLVTASTAAARDDDKEIKEAQKDILDLAKAIEDGKDSKYVASRVAAIKKKYEELGTVMHVYKPRDKGGLGFGEAPKGGIEFKIRDLSKRKLAPLTLQKEMKELIRLGYVNIAMAEIAKPYFGKPKGGKGKKDWDQHLEDQKKAAQELIAAIKAKDSATLKKVADKLDASCNNCHSDFRD
jgi:cytochrome c556